MNIIFPCDFLLLFTHHGDLRPQPIQQALAGIGEKWQDVAA
jgi:hypothetical protein